MTEIANDPTRRMTGGRALAEMLRIHECGPMFGMGGFQLLPFYDAVRELGLSHTLINDERCGAFAADAFARITGRPGVCDATLGPGATNLATGLVESLNAGVPLIAIIGNTNRAHSWKNMTQESRQDEILAPAAKELIRVEDGNRMPELVRRAYTVATSGRPGPVVLDVPEDVAHGEFDYPREELRVDANRIPALRIRPGRSETEAAADLLRHSRRPLILAGGGVHLSGAWPALRALAEAESIPVAHTLSGKGSLPCGHPLSVGLFGRWTRIANDLMEHADCLLAVGCKMGEISTRRFVLPPASIPFIQLDIVAEEIGRSNRVDAGLWGDAAEGLRDLAAALADDDPAARRAGREPWLADAAARMAKWREEAEPRYASEDPADPHGAAHPRAPAGHAGGGCPGGGRRLRGPLDGAPLRQPTGGAVLRREPRFRLHRVRPPRGHGCPARSPRRDRRRAGRRDSPGTAASTWCSASSRPPAV